MIKEETGKKRNLLLLGVIFATIALVTFIISLNLSTTTEERIEKQNEEYLALMNSGACATHDRTVDLPSYGDPDKYLPQEDVQTCRRAAKFLAENFYGYDKMISGKMECISPEIVLEDEYEGTSFSQGLDYKFTQVINDGLSEFYVVDDSGNISIMEGINVPDHFKVIEKHVTVDGNGD